VLQYLLTGTTGVDAIDRIFSQYLGGSGNGGNGGTTGGTVIQDTRIFFTVMLGYNDELRNAELDRKGLDYEDKVLKLEVLD